MCAMSNEIREKERWWETMKDSVILDKWRKDVTEDEASVDLVGASAGRITLTAEPHAVEAIWRCAEGLLYESPVRSDSLHLEGQRDPHTPSL